MKFGIGGRLPDVITCDNFLSIGSGVSILQGVKLWHSPLTKAVAVNTVLRYRAPVIIITRAVLSQGGPRDAAVNFEKKNLQRHRAISVPQHGFPV